jgi:predicted GIY-YIG superfamily endonuclease
MYNLYYLKSNLDNRIYIGITKYPEKRHKDHLRYSIRESHYNGNWIRKTLEKGGSIDMVVLCKDLSSNAAVEMEKKMISLFRKLKIDITNTADGGLGFNHKGIPHSEQHKRNIELSQPHKVRIPKEELIELYLNQKLSKKSIGKIYNCGTTTIDRRLNEYKIPIRTTANYKVSYQLDRNEIISLYVDEKLSMLEIANRKNIGINGIRTLLNREGIKIDSDRRTPRKPDINVLNKVKELYESGMKQKDIAKIMNFCDGYISYLLKRHILK